MSTPGTAAELKQLETRLSKEAAVQKALRAELASIQKRLQDAATTINQLNQKISALSKASAEPIVSEHALLRYLERVKGLDLSAINAEILTAEVAQQIKVIGTGSFPCDGFRAVVKQGVVVTIET